MTIHRTKDERKLQIMDAAVSCFAEKGYYEASMDDIARAAGLSKGSLYWHFPSKRDLFRSLIESWLAEVLTGLPEAMAACETAERKIGILMDAARDAAASRPEMGRAQFEFLVQGVRDPEIKEWFRQNYDVQRALIGEILQEGIDSGEFRPVPVDAVARMIIAYGDGVWLHRAVHEIGGDLGELIEEVKGTLMALLKR